MESDLTSLMTGDFVPLWTVTERFLLAIALGAGIGLDRELLNKPAGLRTHILVSLAAAVFTVITFELYEQLNAVADEPNLDAIRIIEAVTAGVAFLAAGAIIQSRGSVSGLTTGASMWMAGAVGVACGAGFYGIAIIGTVLAIVVLSALGWLESRFSKSDSEADKAK